VDEFKRGAAVLVKRSQCPVVPVAIEGCFDTWPRTRRHPRLLGRRVAVMYGRAIPHDELMAEGPDAALVRLRREVDEMRRQLRGEMRRATGGAYPPPNAGDEPISAPGGGLRHGVPSADGSQTAG
jgi:1-acyl-sn-glycerol-3-phosphate acyltransferase